jgi:hypothetical protein
MPAGMTKNSLRPELDPLPAAGNERRAAIVLYGQGPVAFTYVNAADDPQTKTSTSAIN